MKQHYTEFEMKILKTPVQDVVTASGGDPDLFDGTGTDPYGDFE